MGSFTNIARNQSGFWLGSRSGSLHCIHKSQDVFKVFYFVLLVIYFPWWINQTVF